MKGTLHVCLLAFSHAIGMKHEYSCVQQIFLASIIDRWLKSLSKYRRVVVQIEKRTEPRDAFTEIAAQYLSRIKATSKVSANDRIGTKCRRIEPRPMVEQWAYGSGEGRIPSIHGTDASWMPAERTSVRSTYGIPAWNARWTVDTNLPR